MTEQLLWQKVFIAVIRINGGTDYALKCANTATDEYNKRYITGSTVTPISSRAMLNQ